MLDLSGVLIGGTSDFVQIAAFLVSALVGFWAVRKAMSLVGGGSSRDTSVYYNHDGSFEYHRDLAKRRKEFFGS